MLEVPNKWRGGEEATKFLKKTKTKSNERNTNDKMNR